MTAARALILFGICASATACVCQGSSPMDAGEVLDAADRQDAAADGGAVTDAAGGDQQTQDAIAVDNGSSDSAHADGSDAGANVTTAPVLTFSDLVSGPDTGLGDGLGVGCIVTLWGWNLGSHQGSSTVTIVDSSSTARPAAHVYYWKNADGSSPGGPADLYRHHKLQELAFSLPDGADGHVDISVTVDGVRSNPLPFFVNQGRILWVKAGGDDGTGDGSWDNAWASIGYMHGATTKVSAGDVLYGYDVQAESIAVHGSYDGAPDALIGLVSYPAHPIQIQNGSVGPWGIADHPAYWTFSKLHVTTTGSGISPTEYGRVVGNFIWDGGDGEVPGQPGCAEGSGGAIVASLDHSGAKILGNHISSFGCFETSNQHHTTYFTSRDQPSLGRVWEGPLEPYEFAFNHLQDNQARGGLHDYDEHLGNGYDTSLTPLYVHHNAIIDQVAAAINIGFLIPDEGRSKPGRWEIYNNLIVRSGQTGRGGDEASPVAVRLFGEGITSNATFVFYNNSIVASGESGQSTDSSDGALHIWNGQETSWGIDGTWQFERNLVVDTLGFPLANASYVLAPSVQSHNLFFSSLVSQSAPSWATGNLQSDPQFVDMTTDDYRLAAQSPAVHDASTPIAAPYSRYGIDGRILNRAIGALARLEP